MFQNYTQFLRDTITVSEIELKLIYDFYDILELEVEDSYVFRCQKDLLDDYFSRIDELKKYPEHIKFYKMMRNKMYGTIGKTKLSQRDMKTFGFPIYNRAFSSAVAGIFRDRIARYEQKYVNSEYGLVLIRTDGLYFKKEVPEFEKLVGAGVVKKKIHLIDDDYINK